MANIEVLPVTIAFENVSKIFAQISPFSLPLRTASTPLPDRSCAQHDHCYERDNNSIANTAVETVGFGQFGIAGGDACADEVGVLGIEVAGPHRKPLLGLDEVKPGREARADRVLRCPI